MAATVSSVWAKPGSWALESEQQDSDPNRSEPVSDPVSAEFPSLAAAASTKTTKKKKKPQTLSLAEFTSSSSSAATANGLTVDELRVLPKGPRERTAEELERPRGFRDFGDLRTNRSRVDGGGFGDRDRDRERERDSGFSRADEVDDWSKGKGTGFGGGGGVGGYERRERNGGGLFSSSRADEVDNWGSNKSFVASSEGRRDRRMGFESNGGADSENWGRKKEEGFEGRRYDRERRGGFEVDAEQWGRKKEEEVVNGNGGVRPRLNLQPRTLPLDGNGQLAGKEETIKEEKTVKGANPFGAARPREEVLAEKGKDWKEIEERLEAKKGEGFDRPRSGGLGRGRGDRGDNGKFERSWRRDDSVEFRPHSAEKIENGVAASIEKEEGVAAQVPPEDGVASAEEDRV
ncbi:hypothetical protein Droror1_Dr00007080 [Drosera rotundifolia]